MKLKLFGDAAEAPLTLSILNGGYDQESGRMTFIVRNDMVSGTLTFDVGESQQLKASLAANVPNVERVDPLGGGHDQEIRRPMPPPSVIK